MDPKSSASHEIPASQSSGDASRPIQKRRHRWVWAVVLILFGLLFYWVIQHQQKSQTAAMAGGRRRGGGTVPITVATAHAGGVNVYFGAIGTVTPLNTVSINAQVTGLVTAVHYREGQSVQKGDPLIVMDPLPVEASLRQAQGTLERDQNILAESKIALEHDQVAWSKNAIPRQTL